MKLSASLFVSILASAMLSQTAWAANESAYLVSSNRNLHPFAAAVEHPSPEAATPETTPPATLPEVAKPEETANPEKPAKKNQSKGKKNKKAHTAQEIKKPVSPEPAKPEETVKSETPAKREQTTPPEPAKPETAAAAPVEPVETTPAASLPPSAAPVEAAQSTPPTSLPASLANSAYTLQAGDMLHINVWREEELDREIVVMPDGTIDFPLIGSFSVVGKTTSDVQREIKEKMEPFVPEATVTVVVKEARGNAISVIGQVTKPGEVIMTRAMTVIQALSQAGGLTPYADDNDIVILRKVNGKEQSIDFDYSDIARGKNLETNITLQPGDVIVVPTQGLF